MGKILDLIADVMEATAKATADYQNLKKGTTTGAGNATYGDVVKAITVNVTDGYWKNRCLDVVPTDAEPAKYQAAIAILEDTSSDNFWKRRALTRVFERP